MSECHWSDTKKPRVGRTRLALEADVPCILELITPVIQETFRLYEPEIKLRQLISCSVLSVSLLDTEEKNVIGFLALDDYPLAPAVEPSAWEEWAWARFRATELNARNNLFISALMWAEEYGHNATSALLSSVFLYDVYLEYLTLYRIPPYMNLTPDPAPEVMFRRYNAVGACKKVDSIPALSVASRKDVYPRLIIRRAVEEDNDDIVPIIDSQSDRLKELYGSFYISELIARHPESNRKLLVAEYKETAIGVMCFNTDINYETLEQSYDLAPYCGLKKVEVLSSPMNIKNANVNLVEPITAIEKGENLFDSMLFSRDSLTSVCSKSKSFSVKELEKTASIAGNTKSFNKSEDGLSDFTGEVESSALEFLVIDDDFEFDIVNIDSNLLKVPKSVPYAQFVYGHDPNTCKVIEEMINEEVSVDSDEIIDEGQEEIPPNLDHYDAREHCYSYTGDPNAFVLELFAMDESIDERRGFDILRAAFDIFPDRDYCIVLVPTDAKGFPLLEHFNNVSPNPLKPKVLRESLFLAHRNSITGRLAVRRIEFFDMPEILSLIEKLPRRDVIEDIVWDCLVHNNRQIDSFVLQSEKQPIGFIAISQLKQPVFIRGIFNLDRSSACSDIDGNILTAVFAPVFGAHTRWYTREILRYTGYRTLVWNCRIAGRGDAAPVRNLISFIGTMAPAQVRDPPAYAQKDARPVDWVTPKALWFVDRPLTSLPKSIITHHIVVIGASRTALSFIETLLFGPSAMFLVFVNISLISTKGLPIAAEYLKPAETCVPEYGHHMTKHLLPIFFYVDVISAKMTTIDRKEKLIFLDNGTIKNYDILLLCCGQQFQPPNHLGTVDTEFSCIHRAHDDPDFMPDFLEPPKSLPGNLMLINTIIDANDCLSKLLTLMSEHQNSAPSHNLVIVYGSCIQAYSCLAALLEMKIVSSNRICFVESFPPLDYNDVWTTCFNDDEIDDRIQKIIQDCGIITYRGFHLFDYEVSCSRIKTVRFISDNRIIAIPCIAFFYYGCQAVDFHTFRAINECGLVWDGGLVVNAEFCTNDPSIYAAGTLTKYSRALHADRYIHKMYSSHDVGKYLGERFLEMLNPYKDSVKVPTQSSKLVPRFKGAITRFTPIPGGYYYLRVRPPGPRLPVLVRRTVGLGHAMSSNKNDNLFLLHIDCDHKVSEISCFSKKVFEPNILIMLYGMHERLLGNIMQRYASDNIDDFFAYFEQAWMSALFHGAFVDWMQQTKPKDIFPDPSVSSTQLLPKFDAKSATVQIKDAISVYIRNFEPIIPQYSLPFHPNFWISNPKSKKKKFVKLQKKK